MAVSLALGDRLVLRLEENPTTGYRWELPTQVTALPVESDEFRPPSAAAPGAGGERVLVLRAAAPARLSPAVDRLNRAVGLLAEVDG